MDRGCVLFEGGTPKMAEVALYPGHFPNMLPGVHGKPGVAHRIKNTMVFFQFCQYAKSAHLHGMTSEFIQQGSQLGIRQNVGWHQESQPGGMFWGAVGNLTHDERGIRLGAGNAGETAISRVEQAEQEGDPGGVAIGEQNAVIKADDLVAIAHQVG